MSKEVLITGGAGFIGSHLADELLDKGYQVRLLDSLDAQVHASCTETPAYLNPKVTVIKGDICDPAAVKYACVGVDVVVHLAARVGVGQSMYEVSSYTRTNNLGTAVLLEELTERPVEKLVVASSMSIYGEGLYRTQDGRLVSGNARSLQQMKAGQWDLIDDSGRALAPVPTPESKTPDLASVYALSKYDQERMCLVVGRAYNMPTVALRFFNVYGTRQSLSNPYTGVLAIFASRLLNDRPPLIYEDGQQCRDFVHVTDIAQACRLAIEVPEASDQVFNIGSGNHYRIVELAEELAKAMGKEHIQPQITAQYRVGDIRHCFADIGRAQDVLGYCPQVTLEQGMSELTEWLSDQSAEDHVDRANSELATRGLTV